MTKEDLIKLGLDEATATKIATASAEELKSYVPKAKFDEAATARKTLDIQIKERDKQLETLKKSAGDVEGLKTKIEELQTANKTAKTDYEAKIKQIGLDHAVETALNGAKAKNLKAVKALLDMDLIDVDEDGKVTGLNKQIKKLAESDDTKFLFDISTPSAPAGKPQTNVFGMKPAGADKPAGGEQSIGASFAAKYNAAIMPVATPNSNGTQQ